MNKKKKMSLLIMAHTISLSYVHATRQYISSYRDPNTTQQNTAQNIMRPSTIASSQSPLASQAFKPAGTTPMSTTMQPTPAQSITPPPVNTLVTGLGSVSNYKTKCKDIIGTGYTDAIAATMTLATNNNAFSTSDIIDILKAVEVPLLEKDYTKRLRTVQQKEAAITLFKTLIANITGPKESRTLYKGKPLSTQNESRFFASDETKIAKMLNNAEHAPLTPPDLLDPRGAAYTETAGKSALTKYTTVLQNPLYLNSMLRYLKVFLTSRATMNACCFQAYQERLAGDYRFKNQNMREPVAALAATVKNMVITTAPDYANAGFTSRKELIEVAINVLDILKVRLADKPGIFSANATIKEYISVLEKIKK